MTKLLEVREGKTDCPECGRKVRVNLKRGYLYSHSRTGSEKACYVNGDYEFKVVEVPPKRIPKAAIESMILQQRRETSQLKRKRRRQNYEFVHLKPDPYPENWSRSFRSSGYTQ